MSDSLSVLDIAWLIYAHRLSLGGYPIGITGTPVIDASAVQFDCDTDLSRTWRIQ
jgi:hypothetical protein